MDERNFYPEVEVVQHLFSKELCRRDCDAVVQRLVLHLFKDAYNEGIKEGRRDGFYICDRAVRSLREEAKSMEVEEFRSGFLECVDRATKKIVAEMVKPG